MVSKTQREESEIQVSMFWIDPKGELVFSVVHTSNPLKSNTDTTVSVRCHIRTDGIQQTNHTCSALQIRHVISPFSTGPVFNTNLEYKPAVSDNRVKEVESQI